MGQFLIIGGQQIYQEKKSQSKMTLQAKLSIYSDLPQNREQI